MNARFQKETRRYSGKQVESKILSELRQMVSIFREMQKKKKKNTRVIISILIHFKIEKLIFGFSCQNNLFMV